MLHQDIKNQEIVLAEHPSGKPTKSTFKFYDIDYPILKDNEVILKTLYVSVDPGMRGFMNKNKNGDYGEKFEIGKPITSRSVAQVIESSNPEFKVGDIVHGRLDWKRFQGFETKDLQKVDPDLGPISTSVSILGVTGLAAYFGLLNVGQLKKGETVVVSGAAGSVGSAAVQIAKIHGCKVVGIAGSKEKIDFLENELEIDKGINYKETEDMSQAIAKACPDGVDVFFDNVGGELFDAVFENINKHARMVICGQIAEYNESDPPTGPRPQHDLIKKSALIQGFVVFDFQDEFAKAKTQLAKWLRDGDILYKENLIDGFENIPDAFIGLFSGDNIGKQMVKIADPE